MMLARFLPKLILCTGLLLAVEAAASSTTPTLNLTPPPDNQRGCLWINQFFNTLFPDTQAKYSIAVLPIPVGGSVSIEGDFPHARYMSY
jgi:hypothetical protein